MMAMCAAFGDEPGKNMQILIGQLVNVMKDGKPVRMSKRDRDLDLGELRTRFGTPGALLGWLAGQTGIAPDTTPRSAEQLVEHFSWDVIRTHRENITVTVE